MKTYTFLLALLLALVSCGKNHETGFTIKGNVKNCGEWGNCGHVILIMNNGEKLIADTANVVNGRFTLTGHIPNPDFVSMYPIQSDKDMPKGRILFFLENEKYSVKIRDGRFSAQTLKGGSSQEKFRELSEYQEILDKRYSIQSIDRQLNTTSTPPYRMEALKKIRNEYDSVFKAYKDSLILANTPSYFSLYMTSIEIADGGNLDSIRNVLEVYLKDDRFKNDPRLRNMIEITEEEKRRP